jgi:archaellum component FlaC
MWVDDKQLPLNHMMQETIGNIMAGFSKTLKGADESVEKIEVKIKRLHQAVNVDAHTYP